MDRLYAIIASNASPFMPPAPACTHLGRNGSRTRRKSDENDGGKDSDDRPMLEEAQQDSNDEDIIDQWHWKRRRHKRRKRRNREATWDMNLEAASRLAAFLICILLLIMLFLLFADWTILDMGFAKMPATSGPQRWIQLERICGQGMEAKRQNVSSTSCCTVTDIINLDKNSAKRVLFFSGRSQNSTSVDFESEMALITPQGKTIWNSDTRLWRPNHGRLMNEYVASMALLPFVLGSFENSGGEGQQRTALVIGLGGGSVDMFWHSKFPSFLNITVYELDPIVVELANRWFGVVNDRTRRTVVADGIVAIEEAVKKGLRFDTILVDACDHDRSMPCPAGQFLTPRTLGNIWAALSPMGTFVVNVLPLEAEEANIRAVQAKLLATFPTCIRSRMAKQMNNIFACLPYAVDRLAETVDKIWNAKMREQMDRLGLRHLLADAKLII